MQGRRVRIRRGVDESSAGLQAEDRVSAFERAVQAATPNVATVTASLGAFGRSILNTAFRNPGGAVYGPSRPPPAPLEGTVTGRMSLSSQNMGNLPRSSMAQTTIGVDPALPGRDASVSVLTSVGAGGILNVHDSVTAMNDIANMPSVREQTSREIPLRLATDVATDRIRERRAGAPVIDMYYQYMTQTTHIMFRVWLMGPNQPYTEAVCSISDEEVVRAHRDNASEHYASEYLRGVIVDRLSSALATEVRGVVVRSLDGAVATDEGTRLQMGRILTRRGRSG